MTVYTRRLRGLLASTVVALLALAAFAAAGAAAFTWSDRTSVDPGNPTSAIECPTASLCVVGGGHDHIATATDPAGGASTWRWQRAPLQGGGFRRFDSLSCPSSSTCLATAQAEVLIGAPEGGEHWTAIPGVHGSSASCGQVGCALSEGGAVVVGSGPGGDPHEWHEFTIAPFNGSYYEDTVGGMSCTTYTFTELASASSARPHRIHVRLGSVRFALKPHKPKRVTLRLSRQAKALLRKHGKLKAKFTVKLKNAAGLTSTTTHTYTIGRG